MKFVCPELNKWYSIYKNLRNAWENAGGECPPPPMALILSGWNCTNDYEKARQWKDTVEWAGRFGFGQLIPEVSPEDSYLVEELSPYYLGPTGKPVKLDWDYDAKETPSPEDIARSFRALQENWNSIVGPDLAKIISVQGFHGRKKRRLIVQADMTAVPPWGTWTSLVSDERRRSFTQFRAAINKAIAPLEVDHIDFVPYTSEQQDKKD
jgi:hypothetical protein